jgi:hypothetical protein
VDQAKRPLLGAHDRFVLERLRNRRQYFGSTGKACTAAIDAIRMKAL